jgi:hypothetical protein
MAGVTVKVKGVEGVQANIRKIAEGLHGPTLEKAAKDATMLVTRTAKGPGYVPVDTGRLRASITPEVVTGPKMVRGVVGSNVFYAPFQEEKRGYLRRALQDNAQRIYQIFNDAIKQLIGRS